MSFPRARLTAPLRSLLVIAVFLSLVLVVPAHGTLNVATLQQDSLDVSTAFCFPSCITGNAHAAGVCFHAPFAFVGIPSVSAQLSVASGTAQGTFQADIYLPAAGSDPLTGSCSTPFLPAMATSTPIPVSLSTTSPTTFSFQFPYQISVVANESLMVMIWANNTSAGATTDYRQANSGNGASPVWTQQRFEQYKNGVWKTNGGTCNTGGVGGVCPVFTFNEDPISTSIFTPPPTNPISYPCCNAVSQTSLTASHLTGVSDVDPAPLTWLFGILALLTLGSYLILRRKQKRSPQYDLRLA